MFNDADILSIDQLHDQELITSCGIKASTADLISKQVSKFKLEFKERQKVKAEAAAALLDFPNTASTSDMRRLIEGSSVGSSEDLDDDFFDEY